MGGAGADEAWQPPPPFSTPSYAPTHLNPKPRDFMERRDLIRRTWLPYRYEGWSSGVDICVKTARVNPDGCLEV